MVAKEPGSPRLRTVIALFARPDRRFSPQWPGRRLDLGEGNPR